jgi:hypothetical protein
MEFLSERHKPWHASLSIHNNIVIKQLVLLNLLCKLHKVPRDIFLFIALSFDNRVVKITSVQRLMAKMRMQEELVSWFFFMHNGRNSACQVLVMLKLLAAGEPLMTNKKN